MSENAQSATSNGSLYSSRPTRCGWCSSARCSAPQPQGFSALAGSIVPVLGPGRYGNATPVKAPAPYPDDLVIATKVGPVRDASGEWTAPARPDQLRGQVEENLRQLGRDHLDVVNLRVMGQDSISEDFGALAELRAAGLIRHLGISNARPAHLAQARAVAPVVCVQNRYGVDARAGEEMLRACATHGIAFVPFFSIAGEGREAGAVRAEHAQVRTVARAHGVSPSQVRLAWTLRQGKHVLAIPGTGNPDHLIDNLAAGTLDLTAEEVGLLDSVGCTAP
ncbi:aryl-alcohol dehydrogenase-like predicted oxidoreductase [Streptomyces sp. 2333.5]|uniref:aldo/keto reductase n=1 Tax=unclassified Streptomyces TaxID=2593676 RepID=UPI000899360D|nr:MULTISPECIES: aldo/keto reductase [unclassified Streptomyces]PJJ00512.1 aryl-alcohol dehydrogenase-like predicted oxidoreductase [Streptomyces sp. 2333.5]SEB97631.1 Predicted oxidoreductase [Streptomyces sp. 2314.4]SEC87001.1 Predicted oxidoreductase [Streptomyces sp. 2112.2]